MLLTLFNQSYVEAQTKTKVKIVKTKSNPSDYPFPDTISILPKNFKGNDFQAIYKSRFIKPKGEFESTEAYDMRRDSMRNYKIFAYVLPSGEKSNSYFQRYDADSQCFNFKINLQAFSDGYSKMTDKSLLVLYENIIKEPDYSGTNAFGAMVNIKKRIFNYWGVIINRNPYSQELCLTLKMPSIFAINNKNNLRVLAICSLIEIWGITQNGFFSGYGEYKPTFDNPVDYSMYYYAAPVRFITYWIFDKNTGFILGKYDCDGVQIG